MRTISRKSVMMQLPVAATAIRTLTDPLGHLLRFSPIAQRQVILKTLQANQYAYLPPWAQAELHNLTSVPAPAILSRSATAGAGGPGTGHASAKHCWY